MDITIRNVEFQEPEQRILVSVSYREQQADGTWHSVLTTVFLPWIDSYAEIKTQAMQLARAFLGKAIETED